MSVFGRRRNFGGRIQQRWTRDTPHTIRAPVLITPQFTPYIPPNAQYTPYTPSQPVPDGQ